LHDEKNIARESRTSFELMQLFSRCALVRCRIATGRYHQIRRHANHSGRHVLGDTTHGKGRINALFRERYGLDRLFLHLFRIRIRHPSSGEPMELTDPMPPELASVLVRIAAEAAPRCPPSLS
jgi:23S rRNA-/tRNA-specific pseudouridylate synthase